MQKQAVEGVKEKGVCRGEVKLLCIRWLSPFLKLV